LIDRLVYRSHAVGGLPEIALERIFRESVPKNARLAITGALGFSGQTYIQLLEGPPAAIDQPGSNRLSDEPCSRTVSCVWRGWISPWWPRSWRRCFKPMMAWA
jgi:hypothetical protein